MTLPLVDGVREGFLALVERTGGEERAELQRKQAEVRAKMEEATERHKHARHVEALKTAGAQLHWRTAAAQKLHVGPAATKIEALARGRAEGARARHSSPGGASTSSVPTTLIASMLLHTSSHLLDELAAQRAAPRLPALGATQRSAAPLRAG